MKDPTLLADIVITRFIENGGARGPKNHFGYIDKTPDGVLVSRENGSAYNVTREYVVKAIEAIRAEPNIYYTGPSRLKPYIDKWIYSPLWAMMQLVKIEEIME